MIGDKIAVQPHHYETARAVLALLDTSALAQGQRMAVAIGGESGSGKSVAAQCLHALLAQQGVGGVVLHQDDYFLYPPATNHARRVANLDWVGPQEVRLALLEAHVRAFLDGAPRLTKPLVHYAHNQILTEDLALEGVQVLLVEGTYALSLEACPQRVFMARDYRQTAENRRARAREADDPFIEQVLEVEHRLIAPLRSRATVVVNLDYTVARA